MRDPNVCGEESNKGEKNSESGEYSLLSISLHLFWFLSLKKYLL